MASRIIAALGTLVLVAGCAQSLPPASPVEAVAAGTAPAAYTLGSGDKLRIIVYGEETLTGEYSISDSGALSFPLIGTVPAMGKTIAEVQQALTTRLGSGYIRDPRVSVEVINYRPYYILGEVNKPGEYPYTAGLTLQQAVATAGGYTYRANTRRVAIKRAEETTERGVELRSAQAVAVHPGDTIRVLERFF